MSILLSTDIEINEHRIVFISSPVSIEDSRLPITFAASANQTNKNNIQHKKPNEWLPSLAFKLKVIHSQRVKDWWMSKKNFLSTILGNEFWT